MQLFGPTEEVAGGHIKPPFHMAGIVPVHMYEPMEDFKLPWHASMLQIGPNYMAVERAVAECVWAGADSIWVVVGDEVQPLIRKRLGEYLLEPIGLEKQKPKEKRIPIYYCPITVWDRDMRDSHAWAALHGCYIADKISGRISNWTRPELFYIAWPFGIYDPERIRQHRNQIRDRKYKKCSLLSYNGLTVKDGEYLGFTIKWSEAKRLRKRVWHKQTLKSGWNGEYIEPEDRYSARWFQVEDIFDDLDDSEYEIIEVEEYSRIEDWNTYLKCLNDVKIEKNYDIFNTGNAGYRGVGNKIN
jgi:hypothetical protein